MNRTNLMRLISYLILVSMLAIAASGCRGSKSKKPPIHPNPNMDFQEKYEAQEANSMFADGRAMRMPVAGTIARGMLVTDAAFDLGRNPDGSPVATNPVPISAEALARGADRYDIFCGPCHGQAGNGKGVIMTGNYGFVPAPTYHDDRLRGETDGYMFDVISNGIRNMPAYGYHIPAKDRWAIVHHIRALQRSQNASEEDIPDGVSPSPNVGLTQ